MNISVKALKVHPRNQEFFDDISGEDYERFKTSIKEDGILNDIIVAQDMTILSGHQRLKAAIELGMESVPVKIREDIATEDDKLKLLLVSNFGRQENSPQKKRKAAEEYVRLRGYDNHRPKKGAKMAHLSIEEIAAELGTTKRSLQRLLCIERNLSEPMKQLLDDGVITETVAADIIAGMAEDEQLALISSLDVTRKYTAQEIKKAIAENRADNNADELTRQLSQARTDADRAEKDFESMKKKAQAAQARVEELEKQLGANDVTKSAQRDIEYFTSATNNYIRSYGGRIWAFNEIENVPDYTRQDFIKAINALDGFAQQLIRNIGGTIA